MIRHFCDVPISKYVIDANLREEQSDSESFGRTRLMSIRRFVASVSCLSKLHSALLLRSQCIKSSHRAVQTRRSLCRRKDDRWRFKKRRLWRRTDRQTNKHRSGIKNPEFCWRHALEPHKPSTRATQYSYHSLRKKRCFVAKCFCRSLLSGALSYDPSQIQLSA